MTRRVASNFSFLVTSAEGFFNIYLFNIVLVLFQTTGSLHLDAGAEQAVRESKSLFAAGIKSVAGRFRAAECVKLCREDGIEFARGIINYSHSDMLRIIGKNSTQVADILGHAGDAVCHRTFLLVLQ